jgi:hypothetical protein
MPRCQQNASLLLRYPRRCEHHRRDRIELPDLRAARAEAARALIGAAKDFIPMDGPGKDLNIIVRDEENTILLQAQLRFTTEPKF